VLKRRNSWKAKSQNFWFVWWLQTNCIIASTLRLSWRESAFFQNDWANKEVAIYWWQLLRILWSLSCLFIYTKFGLFTDHTE